MNPSSRLAVGVVCLLLSACGRSLEDTTPTVELALVHECGSIPATGHVVTVRVTEDGSLHVPGKTGPLSLLGIHDYLCDIHYSRDLSEWERDQASTRHLVLAIDRRIPWPLVAGLVEVGLSTFVRIRHFWFVVRNGEAGKEGAIAFIWRGNFGINPTRFIQDGESLDVWIRPAAGHTDVQGVHERVASLEQGVRDSAVLEIHPGRDENCCASWGDLVGVFDAVLRAGVNRLVDLPTSGLDAVEGLWHADMEEQDALRLQRAWVASHRSSAEGAHVQLEELDFPPASSTSPRIGGKRHDGPWGWTGDNVERPLPEANVEAESGNGG